MTQNPSQPAGGLPPPPPGPNPANQSPPPPAVQAPAGGRSTPIPTVYDGAVIVELDGKTVGRAEDMVVIRPADFVGGASGVPGLQRPNQPRVIPVNGPPKIQPNVATTGDFVPRSVSCQWCGELLDVQREGIFKCENCRVQFNVDVGGKIEFAYRRPPAQRRQRQQRQQPQFRMQGQVQGQVPPAPPPPVHPGQPGGSGNPQHPAPVAGAWSFLNWQNLKSKGWKFFVFALAMFILTFFLTPGLYIGEVDNWDTVRLDQQTGLPLVDGVLVDHDREVIYMGPSAGFAQRGWVAYQSAAMGYRVVPTRGLSGDELADNLTGGELADGPIPVTPEMRKSIRDARRYFNRLYLENDFSTGFGLMRDKRGDFRKLAEELARLEALTGEDAEGIIFYNDEGVMTTRRAGGSSGFGYAGPPPIADDEDTANTVLRGRDALGDLDRQLSEED